MSDSRIAAEEAAVTALLCLLFVLFEALRHSCPSLFFPWCFCWDPHGCPWAFWSFLSTDQAGLQEKEFVCAAERGYDYVNSLRQSEARHDGAPRTMPRGGVAYARIARRSKNGMDLCFINCTFWMQASRIKQNQATERPAKDMCCSVQCNRRWPAMSRM